VRDRVGKERAQLGLGDRGERDERLHRLVALLALLANEEQPLRGARPRERGVGRRLEAGAAAELGEPRGLGARCGVELRLREPRLARAQRDVGVRGVGGDDDAGVVPERVGAVESLGRGVARRTVAAEDVELPACPQLGARARPERQAEIRAAAPGVRAGVERWHERCVRRGAARLGFGDARAGARDRRARLLGGIDQAREQRIVELRPPAPQLADGTAMRQRRLPRRRDLRWRRGDGRGATGEGETEGDSEERRCEGGRRHGGRKSTATPRTPR
jgi:hypothetical protein